MKKAKFITSIISLCLMLSVCTFAVYALSSYSFTSNRDLNFSATDEVFFEAEISYNYPNINSSFSFSRNSLGNILPIDESVLLNPTNDNSYQIIPIEDLSINFSNTTDVFQTSYQIKNTGESTIVFTLSGIVYDNLVDQRFTTTVNETTVTTTTENTANLTKQTDTCSYSVEITSGSTQTIVVTYSLARLNSSIDITENLSLTLEVKE